MSRSQQRRPSLKTEADELYFDEYLRRDRQRGDSRSRRNDRLPPLPRTAESLVSVTSRQRRQPTSNSIRTLKTSDSLRSTNTVASAKIPSFKREGYEQLNSRLGDDPLTAVRLMRAQMTQMSLRDRLNDRDVKSQFARDASQILLKAEHELEQMQRQRTDALINGDTLEARRITRAMQDVRAKATYDAYADLLLSEQQLASYGVRSKYAERPSRRPRNIDNYSPRRQNNYTSEDRRRTADTPLDRSRRRYSSQEGQMLNRYIYTPPNAERSHHRYRDRRRPFSEDSARSLPPTGYQRSQSNRRGSRRKEKTTVKKNKRLADIKFPQPKTPPPKPPKTPPTDVPPTPEKGEPGVCPQCYERNPALMSEEGLKQHWGQFCPCLTRCQYCDQVLHVSDLNNHHVNQCQFVRGALKPCPLCGLAQYNGNTNHPNCNLKPPPSGAAWCPLCSKPVKPFSSKDAWRKHLIDECYNNPRNNKRWSGQHAPSGGSSLLGSLNGAVQIQLPTGLMPSNQNPQVPNQGGGQVAANQPMAFNGLTQNQQAVGGNQPAVQRVQGGALNPNQLRNAYNKLREERKDDYIKQQQLDAAAEAEKEEEDV